MKTRKRYNVNSGYTVPVIVSRDGVEDESMFTTHEHVSAACMVCFPRIFRANPGITRTFRKLVVPPTGGVMIETTGDGFDMPLRRYFPPSYVLAADRKWSELMDQYSSDTRWESL